MIYVNTTSKKTKKQKLKEVTAWDRYLISNGVKNKSTKFQKLLPEKNWCLRDGAHDFQKVVSLKTTEVDTFKHVDQIYTGTAMIGIATMHKSNSVPVFTAEQAVDISKMRR